MVQKHAAKRAGLHWDLRLEHGGVLWSWAVRKGPSLDPADRRLAAHVEDHPLDYAEFQGTIPQGQYGAGTVETWDRGAWTPLGDPATGMRKGDLQFVLHGQRLQGRFHLVRLKRRERERQDAWFLIKGHDEHERPGVDALTLEAEIPFRSPEQAAAEQGAETPPAPGAVRGALPNTQAAQLCAIAEAPPEGVGWISEIKLDGYRMLVWIERGTARLVTRNGHDWTARLPALAAAFARLDLHTALLDGEMVALRPDGKSSFHDLQAALSEGRDERLFFFVFDLLHLNGWDSRPCKLIERKRALSGLADWQGTLRYSDHLSGDPAAMRRQACAMGLEGIICKQADAPYRGGRGNAWLKVKCHGREEFIVLGWTPPGGARPGLGSLHVGYYDRRRKAALRRRGRHRLQRERARIPTRQARTVGGRTARGPAGVRRSAQQRHKLGAAELVAEVQYGTWSGEGRLRHPVYLGLREDKPAEEVGRDVPDPEAKRTALRPRRTARTTISKVPRRKGVPKPPPSSVLPSDLAPARKAASWWRGRRSAE